MSEKFSDRIRKLREERRLSQTDLAKRTNLQPSAISHFETGRRSPSAMNLSKLADALGTTADYLLSRDAKSTPMGPAVEQLLNSFTQMSAADQDSLTRFAAVLAGKNAQKK